MDRLPKPPPSNLVHAWMPLWIGDYLGDTIGLRNSQHGAYLLSMMAYWRKGEALTHQELRIAAGREFNFITKFYVLADGRFHHKRIDIELSKARENVRRMKELSQQAVAKRRALGQLPRKPHGQPSGQPHGDPHHL